MTTAMGTGLVERFTGALSEQGTIADADARALCRNGESLTSVYMQLAGAGVDGNRLLESLCSATGIPRAPQEWLARPATADLPPDVVEGFARFESLPVAVLEGVPCVVFWDPESAVLADRLGLPPHRAFLALKEEVDGARAALRAREAAPAPVDLPPADEAPTVVMPPSAAPVAALATPVALVPGTGNASLDDYDLGQRLGTGGMAEVFSAVDRRTGTPVAIKKLHPHLAREADALTRFFREARTTMALVHPHIVRVHDCGTTPEGTPFMVCERVDGGTVSRLLRQVGRLPSQVVAVWAVDLLSALAVAHEHGVTHRDLKPSNLLLTPEGVLKLSDFGISRMAGDATMTGTNMLLGTPAYMAPEQIRDGTAGPRSDLYSVGVLLSEMLTGTNPYLVPDNPSQSMLRVLAQDAPLLVEQDPAVLPSLEHLVERLVAADPARRPASATAALALLEPAAAAVLRRQPGLLRALHADARATVVHLREQQAAADLDHAQRLLNEGLVPPAALYAQRALHLQPDLSAAVRLLERLRVQHHVDPLAPPGERAAEVLAMLKHAPGNVALLRRASDVLRAEGQVFMAGVYLRRYLRARPDDKVAANQLADLLGPLLPVPAVSPTQTDPGGRVLPMLSIAGDARPTRRQPTPARLSPVPPPAPRVRTQPGIVLPTSPSAASAPPRPRSSPALAPVPRTPPPVAVPRTPPPVPAAATPRRVRLVVGGVLAAMLGLAAAAALDRALGDPTMMASSGR